MLQQVAEVVEQMWVYRGKNFRGLFMGVLNKM